MQPVLISGHWRPAYGNQSFRAENPRTKEPLADEYPVSFWADCDEALTTATAAAAALRALPREAIANFLELFATRIEARRAELVEMAHLETALPKAPRLNDVELPRTTAQLRQAAAAAREGSWSLPTIDSAANIRSYLAPIGPVCVFGPNNFPFAFNSLAGGDFAAAIAAGNPVIGKANSSHPGTTRLFAEEALAALQSAGLPLGTVQLIYRTGHADGERLVSDPRVGATGYTGSRSAGLALKTAADRVGKPIYLELSSVNPVVILPGALRERLDDLVQQFSSSCLMGTGQFCTNPGIIFGPEGPGLDRFMQTLAEAFSEMPGQPMLHRGIAEGYAARKARALSQTGVTPVASGRNSGDEGLAGVPTIATVDARSFLENPTLHQEVFGPFSLVVRCRDVHEMTEACRSMEGQLTTTLMGTEDELAHHPELLSAAAARCGRIILNGVPTGVEVCLSMQHGGPYPACTDSRFTSVGADGIKRFARPLAYQNWPDGLLPEALRDGNPLGLLRTVDDRSTREAVIR